MRIASCVFLLLALAAPAGAASYIGGAWFTAGKGQGAVHLQQRDATVYTTTVTLPDGRVFTGVARWNDQRLEMRVRQLQGDLRPGSARGARGALQTERTGQATTVDLGPLQTWAFTPTEHTSPGGKRMAIFLRAGTDNPLAGFARGHLANPGVRAASIQQDQTQQVAAFQGPKHARYLDLNGDGRVDAADALAVPSGADQAKLEPLGEERARQAAIGGAVRAAALEMVSGGKPRHDFKLYKDLRVNDDMWWLVRPLHGSPFFKTRDGVKPSAAIRDIIDNPQAYGFECQLARDIVLANALLKLWGPERFDAYWAQFNGLRLNPWNPHKGWKALFDWTGNVTQPAPPTWLQTVRAGDHVYQSNWDVSPAGKKAGWMGENLLALGQSLYYGHPFGLTDGPTVTAKLNAHRKPSSTTPASFTGMIQRFKPQILDPSFGR